MTLNDLSMRDIRFWVKIKTIVYRLVFRSGKYEGVRKELYKATTDREFNSDDFRLMKLERKLAGSTRGSVGAFFLAMKRAGLIQETGEWKRSVLPTHGKHRNPVYRCTELAHEVLGRLVE